MGDRNRNSETDTDARRGTKGRDPPRFAGVPPGEEASYEGDDIEAYPEWWRRNIATFRAHQMRPYRPPRFADGVLTPPIIACLEADLGITIRIRTGRNASARDATTSLVWEIWVDDNPIETVDRRRDSDGYTVYELPSSRFEQLVRSAVDDNCRTSE